MLTKHRGGVVDGLLSPMEALKGWKFVEVTKCTTENYGSSYSLCFFVAMNKKKWNALPKDVQETIEKINKDTPGFTVSSLRDRELTYTNSVILHEHYFANLGGRLGDRLFTRFYLTHVESDSELPGNLTKAQMHDDDKQAAVGNLRNDQRRDFILDRIGNDHLDRVLAAVAPDNIWAVGAQRIVHWDGSQWTVDPTPVQAELHAIAAVNAQNIWAVGLNWYVNRNVKYVLNYEQTRFEGGAASGDRE